VKATWHLDRPVRHAKEVFREVAIILGDREIPKAITDERWYWTSSPSPRDIVDTGQLRQSQHPTEFPNDFTAVFRNSAEYAMAVHEGAALTNGTVLPPRPFMKATLEEFDYPSKFAALYRVKGGAS
jgi:hypothetical protein